ncbi:GNAT family N-acetyltransferase [Roseimicrobium gellanilyticum]|uniref:GNAT family N-acetyltransferase n=1 Tax=Roseimicrobium gellanilyticum TaxID=748857 RepID=UPI001B885D1E|nr:GNAT family N-acetyltransferase [Roseimicrobium gellanilyticum]
MIIRPWREDDSLSEITRLLHESYAELAALGLRFLATHQDDSTTLRRLREGHAFVAVDRGRVVGTITLYAAQPDSPCVWYRQSGVYQFGQFAVHPERQREGIGHRLLQRIEDEARALGAIELSLDTAETAEHLCRWYARLGFRFIQHVSWDVTNYRSMVFSKSLSAHSSRSTTS